MITSDTFLTINQSAEILGMHWQTIRNYIKKGKLPYHKVGKLVRIKKADLEEVFKSPNKISNIEIEQRYLVKNIRDLERKLLDIGAKLSYQSHVIDHWFLPKNIKTREQHDEWFDTGKGCGVRIREQDNGYTGKVITSLEAKRLTHDLNHNTFLEGEVGVENYESCKFVLEMMDLKEFLTIDKDRIMYKYKEFKISIDDIKDFGVGIEIEITTSLKRVDALSKINGIALSLGFTKDDVLKKSLTVLAMKELARFV